MTEPPSGPGFQRKRETTPVTHVATAASPVMFSDARTPETAPVVWMMNRSKAHLLKRRLPGGAAKTSSSRSRVSVAHSVCERVFAVDILKCANCGGRLRLVEIAKKPCGASSRRGQPCMERGLPHGEATRRAFG